MKKRNLVCMALPFVSMFFVACTAIDVSNLGSSDQQADSAAQASSVADVEASDASTEADSAATESAANDSEFYYEELKANEKKEVDLGNDGKQDTLLFDFKDKTCQMKVNEQAIDMDIVVEGGVVYGGADALFVHKTGADYLMLETYGDSGSGAITLYKWDNGSMKEIDKLDDYVKVDCHYDEKTDSNTFEIYADKVVIAKRYDVFGSWIGTKNYTYDDGFATEEKSDMLKPLLEGGDSALVLKKDLEFMDDSGETPKTAKAGQKIYPCEIKQNLIGFNSEDGQFLGYITYEFNEETLRCSGNGVSEDELFEYDLYVG